MTQDHTHQHVHVVQELHTEGSQLQNQLCVVGIGRPVLPRPIVVHVPQVNHITIHMYRHRHRQGVQGRKEGRKMKCRSRAHSVLISLYTYSGVSLPVSVALKLRKRFSKKPPKEPE